MRYIGLIRVSTLRQVDDGYGLDVQEAELRAWAKAGRHRLVEIVREEGVSGAAPLEQRPALVAALGAVVQERADGIVVPRLDRLARALIVQEQLIAEVAGQGGLIRSASPSEDAFLIGEPNDPQRILIRQILGSIAEYERSMIRLRLSAGLARKASVGGYCGGRPPYGWAAVGGELRPIVAEQKVRQRIKEWTRQGWSTRKVAAALNAEAIPTKSGFLWSAKSVSRVVADTRRVTPDRRKEAG